MFKIQILIEQFTYKLATTYAGGHMAAKSYCYAEVSYV